MHKEISVIGYETAFTKAIARCEKKDKVLFEQVQTQVARVIDNPECGKPLRHTMRNRRRLHTGSFVILYEVHRGELRFLDFDHHDKIYKKYS